MGYVQMTTGRPNIFDTVLGLPPGRWVWNPLKAIQEFHPADDTWTPETWSEPELKRAHAHYFKGHRDAWTREGERLYQRMRKKIQRAKREEAA